MKYRKKPVVVDATRWLHPGQFLEGVQHSAWPVGFTCERGCGPGLDNSYFFTRTLNGPVHICPGDWVIRGVKQGDVYPCTDEVFQATYDPAD